MRTNLVEVCNELLTRTTLLYEIRRI